MFRHNLHNVSVFLFFVLWLVVTQALVSDYGVTWDEFAQRHHGLVVMDEINAMTGHPLGEERHTSFELSTYPFRYHGLLFTTLAVALERIFHVEDNHDIYQMRHHMTAFLFWLAGIFFYLMLRERFNRDWFALLGTAMLLFSPRFFADSFNNPKDMVFLPFYLVSGYTLIRLWDQTTWRRGLAHGLAMSLAVSSRLAGLILPIMTMVILMARTIQQLRRHEPVRSPLISLGVSLISFVVFSYAWWPALWGDALTGIREIGQVASSFVWDKQILYGGTFYEAGMTPWHYLPVWIGITTPPLYLALIIAGLMLIVLRLARLVVNRGPVVSREMAIDVIWLLLGLVPLVSAIMSGTVIYDGWRHLYFVYPFLLALAIAGVEAMFEGAARRPILRWAFALVLAISFISTARFMITTYPNQQVYFNRLAGREIHLRYDVDYWGASYRAAYEKLAGLDPSPVITVTAANYPGMFNCESLPRELRSRFVFTINKAEANYYLTNFRGPEEREALEKNAPPFDQPVYVFTTKNTDYMGIYKLK